MMVSPTQKRMMLMPMKMHRDWARNKPLLAGVVRQEGQVKLMGMRLQRHRWTTLS